MPNEQGRAEGAAGIARGGLEQRFAQVKTLQEGLDKAVETEQGMDSTIKQQAEVIDSLRSQLDSLREEQKQVEELKGQLAKVKEDQKAAREEGMAFLRESALAKVVAGQTTLREVNKVTFVE